MGSFCTITPRVITEGSSELSESPLYVALEKKYGKAIADRYYVLASDESLVSPFITDKKGNIKKGSYNQLKGPNVTKELKFSTFEKIISKIDPYRKVIYDAEKEFGFRSAEGNPIVFSNSEEAIAKMQAFNRGVITTSLQDSQYVAVLKAVPNSRKEFTVQITRNTPKAMREFEELLKNINLKTKLEFYFSRLGIKFNYDQTEDPFYNLDNMEEVAGAFFTLVNFNSSKVEGSKTLKYIRAFKIAIDSLPNDPLIIRLRNLVSNQELMSKIGFSEEILNFLDTIPTVEERARYAAAACVALSVIEGEADKSFFVDRRSFFTRIVDKIKSIFGKAESKSLEDNINDARIIASKVASGFLSLNFDGKFQPELNEQKQTSKTFISSGKSLVIFNTLAKAVQSYITNMTFITNKNDKRTLEQVKELKGKMLSGESPSLSSIGEAVTLSGILELCKIISTKSANLKTLLNAIASENFEPTYANERRLVAARVTYDFIGSTLQNIQDLLYILQQSATHDQTIINTLIQSRDALLTLQSGCASILSNAERAMYLNHMERYLGKTYIDLSKRGYILTKDSSKVKPLLYLEDIVTGASDDINFFERWLLSLNNSSDYMQSLYDECFKVEKRRINNANIEDMDTIRTLEYRYDNFIKDLYTKGTRLYQSEEGAYLRNYFLNHPKEALGWLYDTNSEGKLNLFWKAKINYGTEEKPEYAYIHEGDYANDYTKFYRESKEKVRDRLAQEDPEFKNYSSDKKAILIAKEMEGLIKEWHEEHSFKMSYKDPITKEEKYYYLPNRDEYGDKETEELMSHCPNLEAFYDEIIALKRERTKYIPGGYREDMIFRAPQLKARTIVRQRNITNGYAGEGNKAKQILKSIGRDIAENFVIDANETEWGSDDNYSNIEQDLFPDVGKYEIDKLNRLPLYGINLLKNPDDLSTDTFQALLGFCAMSNNYNGLKRASSIAEITKSLVRNKKYNVRKENRPQTKSYSRLCDYIDKVIYGIHIRRPEHLYLMIIEKILNTLNTLGARIALAGNIPGGAVNFNTGFAEITKEAVAGEYFTVEDFHWANEEYTRNIPPEMMSLGVQFKDDKLSLFIREMDILGKNDALFRNYQSTQNRAVNAFGDVMFLPYSVGEHWMQTIPYLAIAHHIKVYDSINKQTISLYDAFDVVSTNELDPDSPKTLKLREGILLDDQASINYGIANSIIEKLEKAKKTDSISFTEEEKAFLDTYFVDRQGKRLIIEEKGVASRAASNIQKLERIKKSFEFRTYELARYNNMAAEIDNRLHGVYNTVDSVAFQQVFWGKLLLTLKGYLIGMAERRYNKLHYNSSLGRFTEGSITSTAKALAATAINSWEKQSNLFFTAKEMLLRTFQVLALPKSRQTQMYLETLGFNTSQVSNIARNSGDYGMAFTLWGLASMIAIGGGDDDDNTVLAILYYITMRALIEQVALTTPRGLAAEGNSLSNVMLPVGLNVMWDTSEILKQWVQGDKYVKGDYKDESKGKIRFLKKVPYYKLRFMIESPNKALEGYTFKKAESKKYY